MDVYHSGDRIKVYKKNLEVDVWVYLGLVKISGKDTLRVRHVTGFSGHIMVKDIRKIERISQF